MDSPSLLPLFAPSRSFSSAAAASRTTRHGGPRQEEEGGGRERESGAKKRGPRQERWSKPRPHVKWRVRPLRCSDGWPTQMIPRYRWVTSRFLANLTWSLSLFSSHFLHPLSPSSPPSPLKSLRRRGNRSLAAAATTSVYRPRFVPAGIIQFSSRWMPPVRLAAVRRSFAFEYVGSQSSPAA